MKEEITYVSMTGSEVHRKYSDVFVFRGKEQSGVRAYHIEGKSNLNRLMLLHKWWFGMLSFEEKIYLHSLFPVAIE